jgi:hypothetical protein
MMIQFGPLLQGLGTAGAQGLMSGNLFGTQDRSNTSGSSTSRFDKSQIPLFNQQLAQSDQASAQLMALIRALGGQRQQELSGNIDQQLAEIRGMGAQENRDINQRYNSQRGNVGQGLASRGLYNSTVAPGMNALVERDRNAALGQADARQRQYLGGVLGQRAQMLDNVSASQNQGLTQVGMQDYGLRTLIPQQIASSRVSNQKSNTTTKKGGIFSRLFG